jgi:predicted DNA-binding transcriptional regulator YafY
VTLSERHDDLLRLLRSRADWTTEQLAISLGVSRRTILRDLDRLRGRGFRISSLSGPGGGVHLEPTSVMVTSQLTGEEVVALVLTVAVAQATTTVPFASGADKAVAKIVAALPHDRATELQAFMQRIFIGDESPPNAHRAAPIDPRLVAAFERAVTANRLIRFSYTDASGRRTRRSVEPHGLLLRAPLWYAIAWDPQRGAARIFRADRITRARVTDQTFTAQPHKLVTGICPDARKAAPRQR